MFDIPTLETERLRLRPVTFEDWPDYCDLMQSERSVGMGGPFNKREAWGLFCHEVALWHLSGHGSLMIEARESGRRVGLVGINDFPLFPEPELGWFLFDGVEGKGYAFEAALALRQWAFDERGLETLVSYIDADNDRSVRLAERMGAVLDEEADRPDPADLVFRHFRDQSKLTG